MFSRLTNAVEVLRTPVERVHLVAYGPEVPTEEEMEELRSGKPRVWNPMLRFLEGLLIYTLVTYAAYPVISSLFKTARNASLGTSLLAFGIAYAVLQFEGRLHGVLGSVVRLDFLDPFIGNRVKEAIEVFHEDEEDEEDGEDYDLGS